MELSIQAKARSVFGKRNEKLRKVGILPAVLYGKGKESLSLEVSQKEFEKVYRQSGENTLVNLVIEGQGEKKVLIHDVAKHYMKNVPVHIDFYEVDLSRKIHAKVPLKFVGTAPAVKELGGILVRNLNEIEVEALPADLPQFIELNVERLAAFNDLIRVAEIQVADKIKILENPDEVVLKVQAPRTEAELADLEKSTEEVEKAAIEGMAAEVKPAKEGEVSAEGEAPAAEANPAPAPTAAGARPPKGEK